MRYDRHSVSEHPAQFVRVEAERLRPGRDGDASRCYGVVPDGDGSAGAGIASPLAANPFGSDTQPSAAMR